MALATLHDDPRPNTPIIYDVECLDCKAGLKVTTAHIEEVCSDCLDKAAWILLDDEEYAVSIDGVISAAINRREMMPAGHLARIAIGRSVRCPVCNAKLSVGSLAAWCQAAERALEKAKGA